MNRTLLAVLLCSHLLATVPCLAVDLPDLGEVSDASMSLADEARIGSTAMRELAEENALIDDVEIVSYLNWLGGRLASGAQIPGLHFTFFAVNDFSINAFAMPGGYVGVYAGLLLTAQSEGELASVIGHEMAHVTQRHMARMKASSSGSQLMVLAAILGAALAARSGNGDLAFGSLNAGFGASLANQLSFSRDFEREADRVGMQYLASAGFDVRSMPVFFQRLQQADHFSDSNAYAFLRTHPVTSERISEAQNRAEAYPSIMRTDSTEFLLVREKLRLMHLDQPSAQSYYRTSIASGRYLNEGAQWYGWARARLMGHDVAGARQALAQARAKLPDDPMLETLAADIAREGRNWAAAEAIYRTALQRFPLNRALAVDEISNLIDSGARDAALARIRVRLETNPADAVLYRLQARIYADRDALRFHAALGNALYFEGRYEQALEQYQLASKAPGDDFYLRSSIEARSRELEKKVKEEKAAAKS
ncbi:M48 family metalloprotease [Paludibacterium yongneupense]|uniref:M48 family metalloprotease n=1 Tax=Paludibacterium yongneupense TaxID=400061 RepID=UPI00041EEDDD|nr:M48 family metalloprotease [Paludibacterium yongneupense]